MDTAVRESAVKDTAVRITAPRFRTAAFSIIGTAPYVSNKFSQKAQEQIRATHEAGSTARGKKPRPKKDFTAASVAARHQATEGWYGIPAGAFRSAMISACRVVGFQMTKAKLSVFVEADGFDATDGTPLVRITSGEPRYCEHPVRNDNGSVDLRARSLWDVGWQATVRVRWDEDQFTVTDVANLMLRVGMQVGIGEGRPDSPNSTGMEWGLFRLLTEADIAAA
jgi:hypothetical protein